MDFQIRPALFEDAARVTAIYNQGIEERAATFETRLRSVEEIRASIAGDFPMLVAIGPDGAVPGGAGLSAYRARTCYAGIAEISMYLDRSARRRGIGKQLPAALLERRLRAVTGNSYRASFYSMRPVGPYAARSAFGRLASMKSTPN